MSRDFQGKDVQFFYIYKRLAHPGRNGYVDPYTLEERLTHIQEAKRTLGTAIPWICDNMQDELKDALGGAPNSEFVIDPAGKIVRMRNWSDPAQLRDDLTELVGPVRRRSDVRRPAQSHRNRRTEYATGVVPRLKVTPNMERLRIEADPQQQPYYVKLEAFGEPSVLATGDGTIHLNFQLDPVHHVHWNNLANPIEYEIELATDDENADNRQFAVIWPFSGKGPHVDAESDIDPREFLVDLCGVQTRQPLQLTVRYFACSDDEGWCRAVTQSYRVYLERGRDTRRRMDFGGFGGRRGGGRFGFGR